MIEPFNGRYDRLSIEDDRFRPVLESWAALREQGVKTPPYVMFFTNDGQFFAGEEARRRVAAMQADIVASIGHLVDEDKLRVTCGYMCGSSEWCRAAFGEDPSDDGSEARFDPHG